MPAGIEILGPIMLTDSNSLRWSGSGRLGETDTHFDVGQELGSLSSCRLSRYAAYAHDFYRCTHTVT